MSSVPALHRSHPAALSDPGRLGYHWGVTGGRVPPSALGAHPPAGRHHRRLGCLWAAALVWVGAVAPVQGQAPDDGGGEDGSPREIEGRSPRVTSRADVEVRVDSGAGVDSERLLDWAEAVGRQSTALRQCYGDRLEEDATIEGRLRVEVALRPRRRRPALRVTVDELDDDRLQRCIERRLVRVRMDDLEHPETVFVELTFRHSLAGATRAMEARMRRAREAFDAGLAVTRLPDGRVQAAGQSGNGLVRFRGEGPDEGTARRLAALTHSRLSALFDCRRRAGRRGASPAGELVLRLDVAEDGTVRGRVVRHTVATPGADRCVADAFTDRPAADPQETRGRVSVVFQASPDPPPNTR
ncbi:MAG TPA: hypothetical protein RMF84_01345 [Polyangiaceae bacterium LLY-WYZ-14_1]|nr:hypothetical protein [Polyangiaceae bacterium LLY-WYZ-14_1]